MKQMISSSLKFVAPNTSKLIIDDVGKKIYKKTFAKYGKKNKTDIDNGNDRGDFHKSYKETISDSLNDIKPTLLTHIDQEVRTLSNLDDDEPLFKENKKSSETSAITTPYFTNGSSANKKSSGKGMRIITNNFYSKPDKNALLTNKILLNSMQSNLEMQHKTTSAILGSLSIIHDFQQNVTTEFYNDVSDKLAHIGNSIDLISRVYADNENNKYRSSREDLISSIKANGLMFSTLGEIARENYNNGDLLEGVFGKDQNEIKKQLKKAIKSKIFKQTEDSKGSIFETLMGNIKGIDDMVGSMPMNLQYMLNSMKGGSKFKKKIFGREIDFGKLMGNTFGMDMKVDKTISTNKYNKGPMAYNGIAQRAIVNVIPSLLSKILSAVTNNENYKDELIYDYEQGKFTNRNNVKEERQQRLRDNVKKNMSGDIEGILGRNGTAKDRQRIEEMIYNMSMSGKTISDYKGSLTGDKNLDRKIREYYKKAKNKNSFNKNIFNTTMDMQTFFSEFGNDIAGQMAMDFGGKEIYNERRKSTRDAIKSNIYEYRSRNEEITYNKFTDALDKFSSKIENMGTGELESGKTLRRRNNSIYGDDGEPSINSSLVKSNDNIINFLKSVSSGGSFNVLVKGGSLDSIRNTVKTDEEVDINRNASYESNKAKSLAEDLENDKAQAMNQASSDRLESEQNSRIASFEQRRDELIAEMDASMAKIKDRFMSSSTGQSILNFKNRMAGKAGDAIGSFVTKSGGSISKLGGKLASMGTGTGMLSKAGGILGKVGGKLGRFGGRVGKVVGKLFTSPQAVEDAGMTPVYIMGSAVEGSPSIGGDGESLIGEILDSNGNSLSNVSGKGGKLRNILDKGKNKVLSLKDRFVNSETGGKITSRAKDLGTRALSGAKNIGSKALSGGGNLLTKAGGKLAGLASKGGKLGSIAGKVGGMATSLGGKALASGAGLASSAGATAGGAGLMASLGGMASSAGGALAGLASSVGPALAGLAPILGPAAVAALGGVAIAKIGPKIVDGVKNIGGSVLKGIKSVGKGAKNIVSGIGNGAKNLFSSIFSGGKDDEDKKKEENKKYTYNPNSNATSGDGKGIGIDSTIGDKEVDITGKKKKSSKALLGLTAGAMFGPLGLGAVALSGPLGKLFGRGKSSIKNNEEESGVVEAKNKLTLSEVRKKGKHIETNSLLTE